MKKKWDEELERFLNSRLMPRERVEVKELIRQLLAERDKELLKRLPDIVDFNILINHFRCEGYKVKPLEIAKAIHSLIKEKLEGRK